MDDLVYNGSNDKPTKRMDQTMKTALQMYSVRQYLSEDRIRDTLGRVRDMGYGGAEWYGLLGYTPYELAKLTTDAGLAMFSLHISMDDLLSP